jgi:hypothetical protein
MKALVLIAVLLVSFASYAAASPNGAHAGKLYGTYKISLPNPSDPDVPGGVWTLTLRPGGYSLLNSRNPISNNGRLKVAGRILTFSRETLCFDAVGRYRWRLVGRMLRLTLVGKDSCSGNDRTFVLTAKRWRKQG